MRYRVPVRVSVAPVQTFVKVVEVEAESRKDAAKKIGDDIMSITNEPGWRSTDGPLGAIRPDRTIYDTYLDEHALSDRSSRTGRSSCPTP